jgi:hypothetical protein
MKTLVKIPAMLFFIPLLVSLARGQTVWTPCTTSIEGYSMRSVTWTGARAVAVGDSGKIMTSEDCRKWTVRNSGVYTYFRSVVPAGNKVVAMGESKILSSPEGISWSPCYEDQRVSWQTGTWTGTKFVALGILDSGNVVFLSSSDLTTWSKTITSYLLPRSYSIITSLIWTGTLYVATTGYGVITSPDGTVWKRRLGFITPNDYVTKMIWNGSQFVGVGHNAIVTSPDAFSWTIRLSNISGYVSSGFWIGNEFQVIGLQYSLCSSDGATWSLTLNNISDYYYTLSILDIAWTGSQFIAVTYGGSYPMLTSPLDPAPVIPGNLQRHSASHSPRINLTRLGATLVAECDGFTRDAPISLDLFSTNGKRVCTRVICHASSKSILTTGTLPAGVFLLRAQQGETAAEQSFTTAR